MHTKQKVQQEMMGNAMTINQDIEVEYLYDILENNQQGLHIKTTYQRLAMHMELPQKTLDYDSKHVNDENNPLNKLGKMMGKSFDVYISPEGKVTKVEGLRAIIDSIGSDAATQQVLAQQFSDSAFIHMMDASLNIYPNKKIRVGESWQKNVSMPTGGMMDMSLQSTYTLNNIVNDQAHIQVRSDIKLSPLASNEVTNNMEFNLTGKQTGELQTDIQSGLVSSGSLHQEINGNLSAQGFKIPMTIISDITTTGKKR
ncbi:hypothetical protein GCM10023231_04680 [Olivibacter ginsenosidimutans]|uniref:AsmA-like C-terminal domain-containing protein n=2 Tax=Olivibacter ginsenosidimutans TaxID=1176537 RepID=A0ABP9AIY1_9SPHI